MALHPRPVSRVLSDWQRSPESRDYFNSIMHRNRRKRFGLLEAPVLPLQAAADTVSYKVFVSGKSGVGKSALVAKLAGLEVPSMHYETIGIQTTVLYWPVKLRDNGRVLLFRFQLWDCGENALRKFDHLLPACKDQTDAVLHLFSFTDRSSFDDLSNQITRISDSAGSNVKLVVGTKFDQFMHTDVTERELREFQQAWAVPVFCFQSAGGGSGRAGLADIAPLLNGLAEQLWAQDLQAARLHTEPHSH
ncbi:ciliogenesis and planar polarity effector 2-like [Polyodon spathula]|uniref:ciliogenesis and planar polarity effector 2-like n=1 Tax=Polyodon spathula TaxID=7913 RepID=UPI001B7E019C|nr:ciliogenesis and planar polarity effector 2-like [Polyodon spathula]